MNAAEIVEILDVLKWVENESFFQNPPEPKITGQMKVKALCGRVRLEFLLKKLEVQIER